MRGERRCTNSGCMYATVLRILCPLIPIVYADEYFTYRCMRGGRRCTHCGCVYGLWTRPHAAVRAVLRMLCAACCMLHVACCMAVELAGVLLIL